MQVTELESTGLKKTFKIVVDAAQINKQIEAELKLALQNAGELFKRLQGEMDESGIHTYPPGPWHAGLEPFPQG